MKMDFVDLSEIIAVRFECHNCHGAIVVPLGGHGAEEVYEIGLSDVTGVS